MLWLASKLAYGAGGRAGNALVLLWDIVLVTVCGSNLGCLHFTTYFYRRPETKR